MSCYYTSWEQCRATMLGIGGNCVASPYYRAQSTQLPHHSVVKPRHHQHARNGSGEHARTAGVTEYGQND
jgi:hypothetical protein